MTRAAANHPADFFTDAQLDSLQLLYANFKVAKSIDPLMTMLQGKVNGELGDKDVRQLETLCDYMDNLIKVIGPKLNSMDQIKKRIVTDADRCKDIVDRLIEEGYCTNDAKIQDLSINECFIVCSSTFCLESFYRVLNDVSQALDHVKLAKKVSEETERLQDNIAQEREETTRLESENRILQENLLNCLAIRKCLEQ